VEEIKMSRSRRFTKGLSSALLALPLLHSNVAMAADETPRIGVVYPQTGIYSGMGPAHLNGLTMAVEDHGKLLGKKPELVIRDNGTKVDKALSAATELITKEKVHVLIGDIHTPINNALATLADEHKIPFLFPSGGSVFLSGIAKDTPYPKGVVKANVHPYMVYTWLDSVQRGVAAVDVAESYGKRWFFVATDYEHGREAVGFAQKALAEKFGDQFKVVGEFWAKQGEVNYTSAVTNAMAAKPDVVFVIVPGQFVQFQKQAAALGLTKAAHVHWSYGERFSAVAAGDAAYGVTATVDFADYNPDWKLSSEFAKRYQQRFGEWPGWPATSTYQGVRMFLLAIEKAGSLDRVRIMRALQGLEDPNPITGRPFIIRACDQKSIQPLYTVVWSPSTETPPGYWKVLKKNSNPEKALLPCELKANYDRMEY
jgi:branched-chain amino acid transport system substrate-binding protein